MMTLFSMPIFCQEGRGSGRVWGTVTDEDGTPLADVKIVMESTSYDFKLETVSNKNGKWFLMGFTRDVYEFTFSKQGYETGKAQVFLSGASRNPVQDIVLRKISKDFVQGIVEPADRELIKKAADFYEAGQYQEALSLLKEFVDAHPGIYMARVNLAKTLLKLKQYPEAIAEYHKVLEDLKADSAATEVEAKTADLYVEIAGAYQDQNFYEEAAAYYKKAMDLLPPADPAVPFNLAEILFQDNKVDEAIQYYELAAKLKPENGLYELKLGYAFLNKGDVPAAVEHFEKFLTLSPNDPQAESIRKLIKELKKQ